MNRMLQNAKRVVGGIAMKRASTTVKAVQAITNETINTVINQQSATCDKYNASCRPYRWLLDLNTQNLFSRKWQITPMM
jgi:hypothetical protein